MSPIEEKSCSKKPWTNVKCAIWDLLHLDVEEVGFPELDGENSDKTALEKKFNQFIVARSDLLKSNFKSCSQYGQ